MRIYLLNPPFVPNFVRCGRWQGAAARSGGLDYPKWLAYATGVLEEERYRVRLVDAPARNHDKNYIINDVIKFKPDLLVIDSNFSSLKNDITVATMLKRNTGAKTVLTGPPASQFAENILQNDGIDVVAKFEIDFTIKEIAQELEKSNSLGEVKGISYKENKKVIHNPNREFTTSEDLNKIPFVSKVYKKHLNIEDYYLSQSLYPEVQIFTGRGCPNQCTFCSWPVTLMGRKYRTRNVENIIEEFEYIKEEIPEVKEIFIEDDTFTINRKLVREFCDEIKKRRLDMTWSCNTRVDLDYETLKAMKSAGCRLLIVGYESGSDKILSNIKKNNTINKAKNFTKVAKQAGLLIHADFIIGLPGESYETAKTTFDFIKEIKPDLLQVSIATPIPGTEFYKYLHAKGYLLAEDMNESIDENGYQKCIVSYPEFKNDDIEKYVDVILKGYYLNISYAFTFARGLLRGGGIDHARIVYRSAKKFIAYTYK